jgi:membrane protease YdiL (CAAX protease family)
MTANSEDKPRARRSINDLRAPLMMLYVFAFCGGRMADLPMWVLLAVMAPVIGVLAFVFERKLMRELLVFRPTGALYGLGAAVLLYGIFSLALQYASGLFIGATLDGDGSVPSFFVELVRIKGHASAIHPAIVGIAGAVLLGVSEELFWRGFVQTRLMIMMPHSLAVILATVVYAGFYAVLMGTLAAVAAGVCGLIFGFLTIRLRSLVPAMICHSLVWVFALWILPLV